jgi:tetratricopeptide (TPR) repeat protein
MGVLKNLLRFWMLLFLGFSTLSIAQDKPEDTKPKKLIFEDYFYEALKQKGIENYDIAIQNLQKCLAFDIEPATIYYELGKNYAALKDISKAYQNYETAAQKEPNNQWIWVAIYDLDFETKNYQKGLLTLEKLIAIEPKFKEDLVSLYMKTKQFDKALMLINELNETSGKSSKREYYKLQILSKGKYQDTEIQNLIEQIDANPTEESNYENLIYLYSKQNEVEKVFETAQKLQENVPNSEFAQLSLFKTYIDNKDGKKASEALEIILSSKKVDSKFKHRVFNEFLIFANQNPDYLNVIENAIHYFENDKEINVNKEIGNFFYNKKNFLNAKKYYQNATNTNWPIEVDTQILLSEILVELKDYEHLQTQSIELTEIFPNQPQFYYYAGLAFNQLKKYKEAINYLELAQEYVVNNKSLEANINIQMGESYFGLGNTAKKELYFEKADALLKK